MNKVFKRIVCGLFGHDMYFTQEPIDHCALMIEFGTCERCGEVCYVSNVSNL